MCVIKGLNYVYLSFQSSYQWLNYICVIMMSVIKGLNCVYFNFFSVLLPMVELYLCYNDVYYKGT